MARQLQEAIYNNVLFMNLNTNNMSTAEHKEFMEDAIQKTRMWTGR